jgi:hypothetical protein
MCQLIFCQYNSISSSPQECQYHLPLGPLLRKTSMSSASNAQVSHRAADYGLSGLVVVIVAFVCLQTKAKAANTKKKTHV